MASARAPRRRPLSRELMCRGERFTAWRDGVRFPDGKIIRREWLERPRIAAVVTLLGRDRLVLVRQHRYGIYKTLWEVPAGTVDRGESPLACARRECEEETGYRPRRVVSLGWFAPTPALSDERVYLYAASRLEKTRQNCEEDERITVAIFPAARVKRMVKDGSIVDAKSIIALGRHFGWLG